MFADDIILYVENTGDDTHTHKIRINKFSKVAEYKNQSCFHKLTVNRQTNGQQT